jgi:hypothetical protein
MSFEQEKSASNNRSEKGSALLGDVTKNTSSKSYLFYQDMDEDAATTLPDHQYAVEKVQNWYRYWTATKKIRSRLLQHFDQSTTNGPKHLSHCQASLSNLKKMIDLINQHSSSPDYNKESQNFEYVQSVLFSEVWLKSMASIYNVLPSLLSFKSSGLNKEKLSVTNAVKNISSSFLISLFPQDCLALSGEESSPRPSPIPVELQLKGKDCENAARQLMRKSIQLVGSFDSILKSCEDIVSFQRLHVCGEQFKFATQLFVTTFREWKALDSIRMVKSLEDTFTQSYATLIAAKVEHKLGNADERLVKSAEHQVEKIKSILLKILGQSKGMSRIEEICAEVEISNADYSRLITNNNAMESTITRQDSISGINADKVVVNTTTGDNAGSVKLSPSQQQQPNTSNNKSEDDKTIKYLEMLSQLAGIENERLAHELTLDKHYRLPLQTSASAVVPADQSNPGKFSMIPTIVNAAYPFISFC